MGAPDDKAALEKAHEALAEIRELASEHKEDTDIAQARRMATIRAKAFEVVGERPFDPNDFVG